MTTDPFARGSELRLLWAEVEVTLHVHLLVVPVVQVWLCFTDPLLVKLELLVRSDKLVVSATVRSFQDQIDGRVVGSGQLRESRIANANIVGLFGKSHGSRVLPHHQIIERRLDGRRRGLLANLN